MKRFLLLFCTVVLCFALFAVPAFAATYDPSEPLKIGFVDGCGFASVVLPNDQYYITVYLDGVADPIVDSLFTVSDSENMEEFYFDCDDNSAVCVRVTNHAYGMPEIYVEYLESDVQIAGSSGYVVIRSGSTPVVPDPPVRHPILTSRSGIFDVIKGLSNWFIGQLGALQSLFWNAANSSLTFLGVLAVCGFGFAVVFLLILLVVRFLRFR